MKKATNSASMRMKNEKLILSLINKKPISRVDISKKTGLTKAAVSIIVDDLKQRNIIFEEAGQSVSVGRNPVMLSLNSNALYFIGVNITRNKVFVGITDLAGRVIVEENFETLTREETMAKIKTTVEHIVLKSGIDTDKIYKLAVVTPGPVDVTEGKIINPPNFNEWHKYQIVSKFEELLGYKVVFQNVSSATAIAEKLFGAACDNEKLIALKVDEGVGSGIIINDVLFKGPCELGHVSIMYDGDKCECGNRGCLEKYASIPHILKNTRYNSWADVVDDDNIEIIEKEAEYLSCGIISVNNVFAIGKVVLCGDVVYKPERLVESILKKLKENSLSNAEIDLSTGTVESNSVIAASIAINDFLT